MKSTPHETLTGHQRQREQLARLLAVEHLHHAFVFSGPRGVGKSLVARELIAGDFCAERCGTCASCLRLEKGNEPDLLWITPQTTTIKIEQIREVQKQLRFRPLYHTRRWIVLDQAEAMTAQAQNALLRTLEEPPADCHFILVTANADLLLPTIRSRSQLIRFGALSPAEMETFLAQQQIPAAETSELLELLHGIPGDLSRWQDPELSELRKSLLAALDRLLAARQPADQDWLVAELVQKVSPQKERTRQILEMFLTYFHAKAVARTQGDAPDAQLFSCYAFTRKVLQDFEFHTHRDITFQRYFAEITGTLRV